MAAGNATPNPVYGQAYRIPFKIVSLLTGNPITGGLTGLATPGNCQISKDGAGFVNATNAPTETGTSGYGFLDLTAAEMSYSSITIRIAATNTNAIEYSYFVPICDLRPTAGRADQAAIQRVEQFFLQEYYYFFNQQTISSNIQTVYLPNGSTPIGSGTVSNDGNGGSTRNIIQ